MDTKELYNIHLELFYDDNYGDEVDVFSMFIKRIAMRCKQWYDRTNADWLDTAGRLTIAYCNY